MTMKAVGHAWWACFWFAVGLFICVPFGVLEIDWLNTKRHFSYLAQLGVLCGLIASAAVGGASILAAVWNTRAFLRETK
jgi:hypothetical protein